MKLQEKIYLQPIFCKCSEISLEDSFKGENELIGLWWEMPLCISLRGDGMV